MKQLISCAFLLASYFSGAQQIDNNNIGSTNYPSQKWQIGLTFTDVVLQRASIDLNYRYNRNQVIGIRYTDIAGYSQSEVTYDEDANQLNLENLDYQGMEIAVYQKLYLYRTSVDNFFYVRHGLRFDQTERSYSKEDWFDFTKDGNTFLNYENREFSERSTRIGYDAVLGIEFYHGIYSTDIFVGGAYFSQISDELSYKTNDVLEPSFQGFKPTFGIRVAINIGPSEYRGYF